MQRINEQERDQTRTGTASGREIHLVRRAKQTNRDREEERER